MSPEHEKRFQFLSNQFCLYTFHQLMSHSAKCSSACSNMVSSSPRFSVSGVIQMQNLSKSVDKSGGIALSSVATVSGIVGGVSTEGGSFWMEGSLG